MYEVDKDSCTTLKQWLEDKYSMDYKTYRNKSKSRRDNLKYEYYKDTGLIITSDGAHYDARSSYLDDYSYRGKSSYFRNYRGFGRTYRTTKSGIIHFIIGLLLIIAVCLVIYNLLSFEWWFVLGGFVVDSCIACSQGDFLFFERGFIRYIQLLVYAISTGTVLETINAFVWYLIDYELYIFVLISIGVLGLNHLVSYLIAKNSSRI